MIFQSIEAYRIPSRSLREFLSKLFGDGCFHVERKLDEYVMCIPRHLSSAELHELRKTRIGLQDRAPAPAPAAEAVPLMKPEGPLKLRVESANDDDTGLQYILFHESFDVDYDRGALGSFYGIRVSGGLTCKVFEVNACWGWVSAEGSNCRKAKAFKVAVKRLEQETTSQEFAQEYQSLKAITKGRHRNIVDFLNAFRYAEGGNIYYNFAFPLAVGNLKQLCQYSPTRKADTFQNTEPGTPPLQLPADFISLASKTLWSEFEGLAGGLAYLHDECQIVHSDIKPSNILLYECVQRPPFVVAKLTDFGLAVDLNTKLSWRLGTQEARSAWQYDAPEVREQFLQSQELSATEAGSSPSKLRPTSEELKSGDVWKLGSVFVELLSFLVKGDTGVYSFRKFITTTQREFTSDEMSDTRFDDGVKVKDEVLDWILHLSHLDFRARSMRPILREMLSPSSERPSPAVVTRSINASGISPYFDGLRHVYITPADSIRSPPFFDRCKERIESWVGQQMDWWPLSDGERSCPQGYCRIFWEWNYRTLCIDVPKLIAQAYKDNCRTVAVIPHSSLEPSDPTTPSAPSHQESQSYGSFPQGRSARDGRSPSRPPTHSGFQSQSNPSPASTPSTNNMLSPKPPPRPQDGEMFWCVDKAWSNLGSQSSVLCKSLSG